MTARELPADDPSDLRDVVAIDGPSGAGKSTVARALAGELGCAYLDTGAMYRAVTWYLLVHGVHDVGDDPRVLGLLESIDLEIGRDGFVRVNGAEVSSHLRSHEVELLVSAVSALVAVRTRMRGLQRAVARRGRIVAEGRDMSSIVFPLASWKFFLDARPDERARRRHREVIAAGREVTEAEVLEEIEVRDRLDSTRRDAPLMRTGDALYVDTTAMTIDEVVEALAQRVRGGGGGG